MIYNIITIVIASYLVQALFKKFYEYLRQVYYLSFIPGPKGWPIIGMALDLFKSDNQDVYQKTCFKYTDFEGGISKYWIGLHPFISLYSAKTVEPILSSNQHIEKSMIYAALHDWLGKGLVTSGGALWHSRRKLLTQTFHFQILNDYVDVFNAQTKKLVEKVKSSENKPIDVLHLITSCTLDIIMESAMGFHIDVQGQEELEYFDALLYQSWWTSQYFVKPWLQSKFLRILLNVENKRKNSLNILHNMSRQAIKNRKEELQKTDSENKIEEKKKRLSFMDLLLEKSMKENVMSENDIRDEVDTIMFAGHDTISSTVSFFLFVLSFHPEYQEKIRNELKDIFGNSDRETTKEDLKKMNFLECCLKESMRLYPTVPMVSRHLYEDAIISGYRIPKGTNVVIDFAKLHVDPEIYPDPLKFLPERFLPENSSSRNPYAFIPFSAGPRNCIGQKFAMMEAKTVLSCIFRNFSLESCGRKEDMKTMMELVLRPVSGKIFVKFNNL